MKRKRTANVTFILSHYTNTVYIIKLMSILFVTRLAFKTDSEAVAPLPMYIEGPLY
jgi:hypothetical protein